MWRDYRSPKTGDVRCDAASCSPSIRCGSWLVEGVIAVRKQGTSMLHMPQVATHQSIHQMWVLTCYGRINAVRKQGTFDATCAVSCNPSIRCRSSFVVEGLSLSQNGGRSMLCRKLQPIHQMWFLTCCGRIIAVRKRGTLDAMQQVATRPSDVGLALLWKDHCCPKNREFDGINAASCNPSRGCSMLSMPQDAIHPSEGDLHLMWKDHRYSKTGDVRC